METRSAALSDTAWVETTAAKEIIADFRNFKQYITIPKGQDGAQKTLLNRVYFPKILQAQSRPVHINRRISMGGSVWRIWVGLQAVNALAIAEEQGLKAPIAPAAPGIATSVTSAIAAFIMDGITKE